MGKIIENNLYDLFNTSQYKYLKVKDVTDRALYIVYSKKENKELSLSSRNHKAYKLYPSDQPVLSLYKGLQKNYFINPNIQILSDDEKGKIFDDIVGSDSTKDEWVVVFPNYRSFEIYTLRRKKSSLKSNIIPISNISAKSAGFETQLSVAELKINSITTTFYGIIKENYREVTSKKYAEDCGINGDVVIISEADRNGDSDTIKVVEDKIEKFKNN